MGGIPTVRSWRRPLRAWKSAVRLSTSARMASHRWRNASPSGVGTRDRPPRLSSSTPSSFSSAWTAAVTAGWEMWSRSAARVTVPRWHTAEKYRIWVSFMPAPPISFSD